MILKTASFSQLAKSLSINASLQGNEASLTVPAALLPIFETRAPLRTSNLGTTASPAIGESVMSSFNLAGIVGAVASTTVLIFPPGLWRIKIRSTFYWNFNGAKTVVQAKLELDPTTGQTQVLSDVFTNWAISGNLKDEIDTLIFSNQVMSIIASIPSMAVGEFSTYSIQAECSSPF